MQLEIHRSSSKLLLCLPLRKGIGCMCTPCFSCCSTCSSTCTVAAAATAAVPAALAAATAAAAAALAAATAADAAELAASPFKHLQPVLQQHLLQQLLLLPYSAAAFVAWFIALCLNAIFCCRSSSSSSSSSSNTKPFEIGSTYFCCESTLIGF